MAEEQRQVHTEKHVSVWKSLIELRVIALGGNSFRSGRRQRRNGGVRHIDREAARSFEYGDRMAHGDAVCLRHVGIVIWGDISDRMNERKWNLTASCTCMAHRAGDGGLGEGRYIAIVGLSIAMIGLYASNAHLFPIPSMFLTGAAAASGIAWVNSLGILAGGVTSPVIGYIKDSDRRLSGRPVFSCSSGRHGGDCDSGRRRSDRHRSAPSGVISGLFRSTWLAWRVGGDKRVHHRVPFRRSATNTRP